jgi:hypothetical protein
MFQTDHDIAYYVPLLYRVLGHVGVQSEDILSSVEEVITV